MGPDQIAFQHALDIDTLCQQVQLTTAHKLAPHPCQEPFSLLRVGAKEQVPDYGIEDRITQELQALVVR